MVVAEINEFKCLEHSVLYVSFSCNEKECNNVFLSGVETYIKTFDSKDVYENDRPYYEDGNGMNHYDADNEVHIIQPYASLCSSRGRCSVLGYIYAALWRDDSLGVVPVRLSAKLFVLSAIEKEDASIK